MVYEPHRKTRSDGSGRERTYNCSQPTNKTMMCSELLGRRGKKKSINVLLTLNNSRKSGVERLLCICVPSNHFVIWIQTLKKTFK